MIYLDNAATSFPKPNSVKKAVSDCLNKYCGNPGRGTNYMALKASEAIYNTREAIAEFLNYNNPENIITMPMVKAVVKMKNRNLNLKMLKILILIP